MSSRMNWRLIGLLLMSSLVVPAMTLAGLAGAQTAVTTQKPEMKITVSPASSPGSRSILIEISRSINGASLMASLNGQDVSVRFTEKPCDGAQCEIADLSAADGLRDGKNVLFAAARGQQSGVVSARVRFDGTEPSKVTGASAIMARALQSSNNNGVSQLPTASSFLPPSISLDTLGAGGVSGGQNWIKLGDEIQIPTATGCSSTYSVIVLDRQTLQQITAAPESSPQCIDDGQALKTYLKSLTSQDLVIVGTNLSHNTDAGKQTGYFDTSAIGGHIYNCSACLAAGVAGASADIPLGYVAIGAGGATAGTAFENYYTGKDTTVTVPNLNGMLLEDPWGNYNYQPAGAVEYTLNPAPQSVGGTATATISQLFGSVYSGNQGIFQAPPTGGAGGYWLIKVDRESLVPAKYAAATGSAGTVTFSNVGNFYPTNSNDATAATQAFVALANDLTATTRDQLIMLTTIGTPVHATNPISSAYISSGTIAAYNGNFAPAFEMFGAPAVTTLYLYNPTDAMSLISCLSCGNSISGNAAFSTTKYSQQGQTGYIHGLLRPDLHGMYWPVRTEQVSPGQPLSDYSLDRILAQQPSEWPELSGVLLPNASTVSGQVSAYHYLSYMSITQQYIVGAQGNYLDDIHYYFAGTNNTFLDYHIFDPTSLIFPGAAGTCYTWTDPVTNSQLPCFTQQDMRAVAGQMRTELVNFTNVMQFMVNGSVNMKDIVASGNSSAATALIGAASTVLGSTLQPPPSTPTKSNISNILSMVGNVVNLGATIATGGIVPPDLTNLVSTSANVMSAMFGGAGAYAGGFSVSGATYLPSPQYTLATTIGDLANAQLQQEFSIGFDTELDSILGDWGKISQLGPKITNSNTPAFSSPNQVAQNIAITLLGKASQRSFYLSLLPSAYSVQYYKAWQDIYPDMGSQGDSCNRWYAANSISATTYTYQPTYAGISTPWYIVTINPPEFPMDIYIIASPTARNAGKTDQSFQVIDSQLASTLFTTGGLNLPMDSVVSRTGPLSSVFMDAAVSNFDNFHNSDVIECTSGNTPGLSSSSRSTTTTITATPSVATVGQNVVLQAAVQATSGTATGSVDFRDGDSVLGTAALNSSGIASLTVSTLAAGAHLMAAYFSDGQAGQKYTASNSQPMTVTINVPVPDMALTLSNTRVSVAPGTTSSPVALTITSVSAMAGQVNFACSGLPFGMTCNFTPAQGMLASNGVLTTNFTITQAAATRASMALWGGYAGFIPFGLAMLVLFRISRQRKHLKGVLWMLGVVGLGVTLTLGGCSSRDSGTSLQTGTVNVLVNATNGSVTRSVPLTVIVQ